MYRYLVFSLMLFASFSVTGFSQSSIGPYSKNPNNYIPATPEAAAFQKYGDLPVTYQKGVANISIPITTINLRKFSWPVSLSYHSGGNKVSDVASCAGLGWTLHGYGMISNKVVGRPWQNEAPLRFLELSSYNSGTQDICGYYNQDDINLAENVVAGATDYLPDLTYVNTALFNLKAIGGVFFPATDFATTSGNVTIEGVAYSFAAAYLDNKANRYFFQDINVGNSTYGCWSATPTTIFNKTLLLSRIVTYEGDVISFDYNTALLNYSMTPSQSKTVPTADQCQRCNAEIPTYDTLTCQNTYSATEAYLAKIESSTGDVVRFIYGNRSDLPGGKRLDSIRINRKVQGIEEPLRAFVLVHDYFGSGSNPDELRLKLTEVKLLDKNNAAVNKYSFAYNSTVLPNRVTSKAHDWYGYYNGQNNLSLLPDEANRNGNLFYAKACILEKVTYPTGGSTTMAYEMNHFGGLRIKTLTDADGTTATVKVRSFNYHTPPWDGVGNQLVFEDFISSFYLATNGVSGAFNVQEEYAVFQLECFAKRTNSTPIISTVMDLIEQDEYYSHVTEYFGADSAGGKVDYYFGNVAQATGGAYTVPSIELLQKKVWRRNGNAFELVNETINAYGRPFPNNSTMFSAPAFPLEGRVYVKDIRKIKDEMTYYFVNLLGYRNWCKQFSENSFTLSSLPVSLAKTTEIVYEPGTSNVLVDSVLYSYEDANNLQPTRIKRRSSKGDSLVIAHTYPTGLKPPGVSLSLRESGALDQLVILNRKSEPYYTEVKQNMTTTGKYLKTYHNVLNLLVVKAEKEYPAGGSAYYQSLYTGYDAKGNLIAFEGKDKISQAMIYDSSHNLVAVAKGTFAHPGTFADYVAYTSFEKGDSSGWKGIIASNIQPSGGLTGSRYYQQDMFTLSKSIYGYVPYRVTYWSKAGAYAVQGTQVNYPKTLHSVTIHGATWTLYEHLVSAQGTITITGSGAIDEIRVYPTNAQMTTYCYEPRIGIHTICDANDQITYYEYDNSQRLKVVRDSQGNIRKQVEYRYATQ